MPSAMVNDSDVRENFQAIYPGTCQKVAIGSSSTQSSALSSTTSIVRVVATSNCHVKVGANPTAVADGTCVYLTANVPEYFGVAGSDKIAVIEDSASGNLFITEGAASAV